MERLPKSEVLRKELSQVLAGIFDDLDEGKLEERESWLSMVMKKGAALILQELLEKEATEFLGRDHYQRAKGEENRSGYRNGYEPRKIRTGEGKMEVYLPQVRGGEEPFRTKLGAFLKGNTEVLEKLTIEMYARGLSTRDIEDALLEATGDMVLSKTAVSEVTEQMNEEFEAFQNRDLSSFQVEYLFLDAIYESIRKQYGVKEGILCAWGICRGGKKVLLSLGLGNQESYEDWLEFLRDMVKRGLPVPTFVTSDGAPGLIKAIEAVFPKSIRGRCWFHRMENFSHKVPQERGPKIKLELIAIRDAKTYKDGLTLAQEFGKEYSSIYPSLVKALNEDLEALLSHLKLPVNHRIYCRTTNLIERSFAEERRRTKVIPGFLTEKSALKLVFSTLIRASKRWQRVTFTEEEINFLDNLRKSLDIGEEMR